LRGRGLRDYTRDVDLNPVWVAELQSRTEKFFLPSAWSSAMYPPSPGQSSNVSIPENPCPSTPEYEMKERYLIVTARCKKCGKNICRVVEPENE
ncbi:MAG: hypothetical protein N3G20_07085, partial [Verrucomicrobiae bacterium]|nr:hypothetical protein [Verrucomicrobiae bacterium]